MVDLNCTGQQPAEGVFIDFNYGWDKLAFAETKDHVLGWLVAIPMAIVMLGIFLLCIISNIEFRANDRWLPGLMMFDKRGKYLLTEQERKRGIISAIGIPVGAALGLLWGFIEHKGDNPSPVPAATTNTENTDPTSSIVLFILALILVPLAFAIRMKRATVEEERRHWLISGIDSMAVITPIAILGLFMTLAPDWIAAPLVLFGAAFLFFLGVRHKSNGRIRNLHDAVTALVLKYWKI